MHEERLQVGAHRSKDWPAQDHTLADERRRRKGQAASADANREHADQRRAGASSDFALKAAVAVVMLAVFCAVVRVWAYV